MEFVTAAKITLHYTDEGVPTGNPLVFLNSLGTDLRIWDKLLPHFAARHRLIRYDKRGHGLSDCPPGPYTLRDHTNDLAFLLAHLQVKQAILIGDSVGGMIALDFALCHAARVRALVLCDTAAKIGTAAYWHTRINALHEEGIIPLADGILARWFSKQFAARHPAAYQGYYNMLTRTPLAGYIGTCAAIRDADLRAQVGQVAPPALLLCGAEDEATPPQLVQELAEALPHGRFALIPKAGHIPGIEQPAAMAAIMSRFFAGLSRIGDQGSGIG